MAPPRPLDVRPVASLCKALSEETRVRIVALLSQRELCVCDLETTLELPQPTVSRHLAVLRAAGVVESRREGLWVYYRIAPLPDEGSQALLETLVSRFAAHAGVRRDVQRLLKAKGPGACR